MAAALTVGYAGAVPLVILAAFFTFFFRDPDRQSTANADVAVLAPADGRVLHVNFTRGRFLPAYHRDAASANEHSEIWIEHNGQTIVFRQLVGMLARRVVCRVQAGAQLEAGERVGLMKFGSRMDVFLPTAAQLRVSVGDRVIGGVTVIAIL